MLARSPRGAFALPLTAMLLAALVLGTPGDAAAAPRISLEVTPITFLQRGTPAVTLLRALVHVEAQYVRSGTSFNLTLDPGVLLDLSGFGTTEWAWGVTEAYAQHRRGAFDLRLGIERLPLETARLMIPFSIEDVDVLGTRHGRAGVRAVWHPDSATRLRAALLEHAGGLYPAVSLRRQFASFELEGHALSLPLGRTAAGVGGSGLVGALVVYGEAWTLTAPAETRYAIGFSGSIRDGLWMLEAGNAASAAVARLIPGTGISPQLAGQISHRISDEVSVTGTARALADPDALRGQLTVHLTRTAGNADYTVSVTSLLGPAPRRDVLTATIAYSF
jgi:hypothetical protein